ncbi:MAG TPA: glycine C-acetyltransferase, partial [Bacteroidales bacterium]|nr:glycine C-acetyltransferase [Bacteroidales bacterium]
MYEKFKEFLSNELESIRASGLYKDERVIHSPQAANIKLADNREVLNFCANNYLGLSNHPL